MDRMTNKYRFRNAVLKEKQKTMDNVLSSIHFYLPDRRQEHLRAAKISFTVLLAICVHKTEKCTL
jgi:hypothetical protein